MNSMDSNIIGAGAAVITAVLWTTCSVLFASAGKRIGALNVNTIRIVIAVFFLTAAHLVIYQTIIPSKEFVHWKYLGLSGIIGLALGDFGYFGTLVILGPRKGVLMMSTAPIFSTIFGFIILDEYLGIWVLLGIALTLTGVFIVVLEQETESEKKTNKLTPRKKFFGIMLGMGGALGQGLGYVVAKYGLFAGGGEDCLDSLSATYIRMLIACAFILFVVIFTGKMSGVIKAIKDSKSIKRVAAGAFTGPFIGVWLSMVAITKIAAGIASTLMALMPIFIIPYVWLLYKEKVNRRGIIGAFIAVIGAAFLFLYPYFPNLI